MDSKVVIGAVVVLLVVIGIIVVIMSGNKQQSDTNKTGMSHSSKDMASTAESERVLQEADQITYKGFAVAPRMLTVKKGTTVTWVNQDDAEHDVTPDIETDEFKASQLFGKGQTYTTTFNSVGKFGYHCSPHPYMKGIIEVVE